MERLLSKRQRGIAIRRYYSKENELNVDFLQYTPLNLVNIQVLKEFLLENIENKYIQKINKIRKGKVDEVLARILGNILKRYFEWVILKCLEGYAVQFINDYRFMFKIQPYYPTDVELKRKKDLKNYIRNKKSLNKDKLIGDIKDFRLRHFRIVLLRYTPNGYKYTGYFLRLNSKYKKLLAEQIKINPKQYDFTI